jgi:hypothetical protein
MGGLEPTAFRLTAERANQLRHKSTFKSNLLFHINLTLVLFYFSILTKKIDHLFIQGESLSNKQEKKRRSL